MRPLAWLHRWRRAWTAVRGTGVLGRQPVRALAHLAWCLVRHGASLQALLAWHAVWRPGETALTDPDHVLSYRMLAERVAARQQGLWQTHRPLRRVALWGGNQGAYVEALLACSGLGADTVLLNTQWDAEALAAFFRQQPVDLVLCDAAHAPRLEAVLSTLPSALRPTCQRLEAPAGLGPRPSRRPWLRSGRLIIWSSGTTGTPRAANPPGLAQGLDVLSGLLEGLRPRSGEAVLLATPLLHGQGLATLALCLGLGAGLSLLPRPRAEDVRACIARHQIRTLVLVPTILHRLLQEVPPGRDSLADLHAVVCGSAPLEATLATRCLAQLGPILYNLYGSTEAGLIALATPQDLRLAPASVGRVLPGVRVSLVSGAAGPGLLRVGRGSGWVDTGDLGRFDAAGRLHLLGRRDELLICGAEKVFPQMLESRIRALLPYVQEALVGGRRDAEYGHAILLGVVLRPGHEHVTPALIEEDLGTLLPRTLRPRLVRILPVLPTTLTGKPLRRALWPRRQA